MLRKLFAILRFFSRLVELRLFRSTSQNQHLQSKRYYNAKLERSTSSEQSHPMMQRWLRERPQEEPWNGLGL